MYRLTQAGILAQKFLEQRLNEKGNQKIRLTPGYWKHDWRPVYITLFVDNFVMKYVIKEHANNLLNTLNEHYII